MAELAGMEDTIPLFIMVNILIAKINKNIKVGFVVININSSGC